MENEDTDAVKIHTEDNFVIHMSVDEFINSVRVEDDRSCLKLDGKSHVIGRSGGPAIIYGSGQQEWYSNGHRHRVGDLPAVIASNHHIWFRNGVRHRENGPAVIFFGDNGEIQSKTYWLDGEEIDPLQFLANVNGYVFVRLDLNGRDIILRFDNAEAYQKSWKKDNEGRLYINLDADPSMIPGSPYHWVDESGQEVEAEAWSGDFYIHAEDRPAIIWPESTVEWMYRGKPHREDGPAIIQGHSKDKWTQWYVHGKLHREGGPATRFIVWDNNVKLTMDSWYKNGVRHRDDGPADISYNQDGKIIDASFWEDGVFKGGMDMLKPEPGVTIEELTADQAMSEYMIVVSVLDLDGNPTQVTCNARAFDMDIAQNNGIWSFNGRGYAEQNPRLNGDLLIHRDDDEPAVVFWTGRVEWFKKGQRHRDEGPAVITSESTKEYWINGEQVNMQEEQLVEEEAEAPESVQVRVKIKSFTKGEEQVHTLFFFSEEEYKKACYLDDNECYRIRLGDWVDELVHCESGPAVEYSDGRRAYVVNGRSVQRSEVETATTSDSEDLAEDESDSDGEKLEEEVNPPQIVITDEDRPPVIVSNHDLLWEKYLIEDLDGRIRWRDTGEVLSNKYVAAINYSDGTKAHLVNGRTVDPLIMHMENSQGYQLEYISDWKVPSGTYKAIKGIARLDEHSDGLPYWKIEVVFDHTDFTYEIKLPFVAINPGTPAIHPIIKHTDLAPIDAFRTGQFAHNLLFAVLRKGVGIIDTPLVKEAYREDFREHLNAPFVREAERLVAESELTEKLERAAREAEEKIEAEETPIVEEDSGLGLPLACLAIAGLAGIAAKNKKKKKAALRSKPVVQERVVEEKVYAVAR